MKLAIENFAKMKGDKKILMLGGMAELGQESELEHKQLVALIQSYQWLHVILVGAQFKNIHQNYLFFNNAEEARNWFKNQQIQNSQILIKGSRSIQMEKILD